MKPKFRSLISPCHSTFSPYPVACAMVLASLTANAQNTYIWTGGVDGNATAILGAGGLANWTPEPATTDYASGTANTFIMSTRIDGGPGAPIGNNLVMGLNASPRMGEWIFDDTNGHFPAELLIGANDSGITTRALYFDQPDTTAITLTNNVTTRVKIGHLDGTYGRLSLRLPASGTTTFHVAHPDAVLDFSGTLDTVTGRGGISGGTTTQSLAHAKIRKTGAGTLDLRTSDIQGNPVLGTIVEGGIVIISAAGQLGWSPSEPMADHLIVNGGTLNLVGLSAGPTANRGIQVGENLGTFQANGATVIFGPVTDVLDESGVFVKTGPSALRLAAASSYSGGTLVQEGVLRATVADSFGTGTVSISNGAGISTFGVATLDPAPLLPNPISVLGSSVIFGDSGASVVRNTLRLGGDVDLTGNNVSMQIDYNTEMDGVISNGTITSITARANDHSLVLNGNSTLPGTTTVERGGLIVNGDVTANLAINRATNDPAAVAAVGGAGTITGNVVVDGELRPGSSFTNAIGTLSVVGDVTLSANSRIILEAGSTVEIDQITATGNISIDGVVELALNNGFDPQVDDVIQLLDLSGNVALGPNHSLSLPFLGASKLWDTSEFATNGTVTVIAGSVTQETFTWIGDFPGVGTSLTDPANFTQWNPEVVSGNFDFGTANTFILATKFGDPAVTADYTFTLDASPHAASLFFDDPAGLFPTTVNVHANAAGTDQRVIWFDLPNTTAITLGNDFTSTLRFGGDPLTSGPLGFRLPSSGTTTFHVANESATLDLGGLLNNDASRGAIHGGSTTFSQDHARIRKTGAGTLDIRNTDPEGNRILGTTIEGGSLIVSRSTELGWNPTSVLADQIIINGGTLRWLGNTVSPTANRGFQIGGTSPTIEVGGGTAVTIFGVISDLPSQSSQFIKKGINLLTLSSPNTFSGGLRIEEGRVSITTTGTPPNTISGTYGTGLITLGENAGIGTEATGLQINNNLLFDGTVARFGFGTFLNTVNGNIDLNQDVRRFRLINSLVVNGVVSNGGLIVEASNNTQSLQLNAANPYNDVTVVERGRLIVNGAITTSSVLVTREPEDPVDPTRVVPIGAIGGSGVVNGTVTVSGELLPGPNSTTTAGTLTINGDLSADSSSVSIFQLVSNIAYDKVIGLNSADLDGKLTVVLVDTYVPAIGASFDLIDSTSALVIGTNFQFNLPALPSGSVWDTSSFATNGVISVIAGSSDPYDTWATENELAGPDADRNFDFDKDGYTNLQEFLFGGDPKNSEGSLTPVSGSGGVLTVTYLELIDGGTYTIQANEDLAGNWDPAVGISMVDPVDQSGVPTGYVRRQFTSPITTRDFFRVEGVEN